MNPFSSLLKILTNKYLLTGVLFVLWVVFFDARDLITHSKHKQELRQLEESKKHYTELIEETRNELDQIKTNPAVLEKYARERFRMKKDNEDLYIIPE